MILLVLLKVFLDIFVSMIVVTIILSWFVDTQNSSFYRLMHLLTNWYMSRFSGLIVIKNVDLTPIIGIILLEVGSWGLSIIIEQMSTLTMMLLTIL